MHKKKERKKNRHNCTKKVHEAAKGEPRGTTVSVPDFIMAVCLESDDTKMLKSFLPNCTLLQINHITDNIRS